MPSTAVQENRRWRLQRNSALKIILYRPEAAGLPTRYFPLKLKDLLKFNPAPAIKDIELLKIGRHFRLSPSCKIVVGRDESENELIQSLASGSDCLLEGRRLRQPDNSDNRRNNR